MFDEAKLSIENTFRDNAKNMVKHIEWNESAVNIYSLTLDVSWNATRNGTEFVVWNTINESLENIKNE
jgi:hypothetical protein